MTTLSYPTTSPLPSNTLLPTTHSAVKRALSRLTRSDLVSLALDWLADGNQPTTSPYLLETPDTENDDLYPPASSLAELRRIYTELGERAGSKRDLLERILDGDWRNGVSLYALAMADMQFLYSHPSSQKWLAMEIVPLSASTSTTGGIPHFHPATFLRNMQRQCLPDVKVHYSMDRHNRLPLLFLRVWVLESPYNTPLALVTAAQKSTGANRTFFIAFPDFSPYVYISAANTLSCSSFSPANKAGDSKSLQRLILEAIPKAFSKPHERYKLQSTGLSAGNIEALIAQRGNRRTNAAGGGWAVYAATKGTLAVRDNPLCSELPPSPSEEDDNEIDELALEKPYPSLPGRTLSQPNTTGLKRKTDAGDPRAIRMRKRLAIGRFGESALPYDGKGIERLDIRIEDPFYLPYTSSQGRVSSPELASMNLNYMDAIGRRGIPLRPSPSADQVEDAETDSWRPDVSITFTGSHIFAGIRKLVEYGIVDGFRMPGWMTGEQGISAGVIRDGRLQRFNEPKT